MLQGEHSAILSTFIKLAFVIKTFVLSIFEWPFYTGFTVPCSPVRTSRMARTVYIVFNDSLFSASQRHLCAKVNTGLHLNMILIAVYMVYIE